MDFLLIVIAVFLIANIVGHSTSSAASAGVQPLRERTCPPHKWRHEEIKDHEGTVHGWKLVCDVCGPLKAQEPVEREKF